MKTIKNLLFIFALLGNSTVLCSGSDAWSTTGVLGEDLKQINCMICGNLVKPDEICPYCNPRRPVQEIQCFCLICHDKDLKVKKPLNGQCPQCGNGPLTFK